MITKILILSFLNQNIMLWVLKAPETYVKID